MKLSELPALGAPLQQGIFAGITTQKDGTHCAVVLLADKPSKPLPWAKAMEWAQDCDAQLPTRPVAAMLFANVRDQFERDWHWTNEVHEHDGSYAWGEYFRFGIQLSYHKSAGGHARAVRLIQLTA